MYNWKLIAQAHGVELSDAQRSTLEAVVAQAGALKGALPLESEPAPLFSALPFEEESSK
ncbi:MAG: hypothetical protein HYZ37_15160 [Candidatus Solibacter usitatus]|nr:hypothetical protein [Candidatus Solibacter usitatus]